jgi:hypothetical protein
LRHGDFAASSELTATIDQFIDLHNEVPKPFKWPAEATDILKKAKRARSIVHNRHSA